MTATPSVASTAAMPLMPAPPMPMKWTGCGNARLVPHARLLVRVRPVTSASRRRASSASTSSATRCVASGRPAPRWPPPCARAARGRPAAPPTRPAEHRRRRARRRRPRRRRRAAAIQARVLALVVGGGVRVRDQDGGPPERGDLGHRPAGAADDEVGGGHGVRQILSVGQQLVALNVGRRAPRAPPHLVEVARSADVHQLEVERGRAEGVEAGAVEALRALAAAEHEHHRQVAVRPKAALPVAASAASCAADSGRPVTTNRGGSRPAIGKLRQTRDTSGASSRLVTPRWASLSMRQRRHAAQGGERPPPARSA